MSITAPIGYSSIPRGRIAAIVTFLEMRNRPPLSKSRPFPPGFDLEPLDQPSVERYRALYRTVGQDWLWSSRLIMSDSRLREIIHDPRVEILALRQNARDVGILELDFREPPMCELAFFGLAATAIGQGIGRTLMQEAIRRAWSQPIERLWVHTCTFDHPAALDFYGRSGFTPYAFQIEVQADPRLTGAMLREAAPHIPLLEAN